MACQPLRIVEFNAEVRRLLLSQFCHGAMLFDPSGWRHLEKMVAQPTIFDYLRSRLKSILQKRAVGHAGWAFRSAIDRSAMDGMDHITNAFVWSSGDKQHQMTELGQGDVCSRWWPCIVTPMSGDSYAFLCSALAHNLSRPWECHWTRLFVDAVVEEPGLIASTCVIEELS